MTYQLKSNDPLIPGSRIPDGFRVKIKKDTIHFESIQEAYNYINFTSDGKLIFGQEEQQGVRNSDNLSIKVMRDLYVCLFSQNYTAQKIMLDNAEYKFIAQGKTFWMGHCNGLGYAITGARKLLLLKRRKGYEPSTIR